MYVCMYICVCMYVRTHVRIYVFMYECICICVDVYIYVCVCVYLGGNKGCEQRLQTANQHTNHIKESSLYQTVRFVKVIKRQEPQVLEFLNMVRVVNLFSFVRAINATSGSIPFIIFYGWILTVCYKYEKLYLCQKKHKFIIYNMRCAIVCTLCTFTADVQFCVSYVQLLQMCNCVYLMYSYFRCAIVCTLCTVTADVQLCVPYVQLLQKCNCVYYVQLLQICYYV